MFDLGPLFLLQICTNVTTGEVGSMVREAIKRGEAAMAKEAQENGAAHQNAE
ncbi:hypothetical protein [Anaerospora hongkongensis]|uniref:hypothetical protein n=1 Tax=Anaerospora hongkongensis TaxID=244830 RepID=UPI0028A0DA7B|nr:hypothetical protein [Anaerospora hongkongensis]